MEHAKPGWSMRSLESDSVADGSVPNDDDDDGEEEEEKTTSVPSYLSGRFSIAFRSCLFVL